MRRIASISGVLLCLLAALWWLSSRAGRASGGREAPDLAMESRQEPVGAAETPASQARRAELDSTPGTPLAPSASAASTPCTLSVLRASDRSPLAGVEVELGRRDRKLVGKTDARGEARFELAGTPWNLGEVVHVEVAHARDGEFYQSTRDEQVLFSRTVALDERVVLMVEDCVELSGRIVDALDIPVPVRLVQAYEPGSGARYTSVFLGRDTEIGSDAAFSMLVCGRQAVPEVELEVELVGGSGRVQVPWNELASDAGALVRLELAECAVDVRDERGIPLAGATVRAQSWPRSLNVPQEVETGVSGEARFRFPPGDVYVSAGKSGHAPAAQWLIQPTGSPQRVARLTLRTLSTSEAVSGLVRLADGSPVASALVTAVPLVEIPNAELGGAAMVQVESGADGRFRLPWAADAAVELIAYGRKRGLSRKVVAEPGVRDVELVIEEQGALEIRLEAVGFAPEYTSGFVEYVLIPRFGGAVDFDHVFGVPFKIEELLTGDYDLWVLDHGWGVWGEGFARVEPGQTASVTLPARPLQVARGTLRRADGSPARGVRLRPLVPGWPAALAEVWTATVARDGHFELVLGASPTARVLPLDGERELAPFPLAAGDGQDFVLP